MLPTFRDSHLDILQVAPEEQDELPGADQVKDVVDHLVGHQRCLRRHGRRLPRLRWIEDTVGVCARLRDPPEGARNPR